MSYIHINAVCREAYSKIRINGILDYHLDSFRFIINPIMTNTVPVISNPVPVRERSKNLGSLEN